MNKYPVIYNDLKLGTIGFYELAKSLVCPMSGLSSSKVIKEGHVPEGKISRKQIIGDFFHALMDQGQSTNRDSIANVSRNLIEQLYSKYKRYFELNPASRIEEWPEITNAMKYALKNKSYGSRSGKILKEILLFSASKRFKGKPDRLEIEENSAILIDYKSSSIFNADDFENIKDEYRLQLEFYSLIIFDNFPSVDSVNCNLIGLKNERKDFVLLRALNYPDLIFKFNQMYDEIEAKLNSSQSTLFSEESCLYCNYKIICNEFQKNQNLMTDNRDIFVLKGIFIKNETINNDVHAVFNTGKVRIPSSKKELLFFKAGTSYAFYNLIKTAECFSFGTMTEVYEC